MPDYDPENKVNGALYNAQPNRSFLENDIMRKTALLFLATLVAIPAVAAKAPFSGPDFGGTYECKGDDNKEGAYTGKVSLQLVPEQSDGKYGAYRFKLEVPGYGIYSGQAAASGTTMGIHFALADQSTKDYGTGIAQFSKSKTGKWQFTKFYYEPEFKGGNFGTEKCVQN